MDMMTITQLAQQTDLAPPTIRRYLDDFILYVPSVRVDQTIGFPPEAITVINTVHALTERGHSHSEIVAILDETYPITVISAQPLSEGQSIPSSIPAITGLLQAVDDRYGALLREIGQIRSDIDTYAESGPLAHVPSELGQIRQVISMLARRVAEASTAAEPELAELRQDIAELRATVHDRWASMTSPEALGSLKGEIALLKQQLAELRSERGQLFALITGLQETLLEIRSERAEDHSALTAGSLPTPLFSLSGPASPSGPHRTAGESAAPNGRTPRRLGHTTAR